MIKNKNKFILLPIIAVAIAGVGFGVCQNYELRMAHKQEKFHVAQTVQQAAYFLYTTRSSIDTINNENKWDDLKTRDSFRVWLAYAQESLNNANSTLNDFPSLVSFQDRTNMNDITSWYSQWWSEVANILSRPGPLTDQDKEHISRLSNTISKVEGFYDTNKFNDWDGISSSLAELHQEWKKAIEGD